jgi:hypothetical protein
MLPHNIVNKHQLFIEVKDVGSDEYQKIGLWESRRAYINNLELLKKCKKVPSNYNINYNNRHSKAFAHIPSQKVTWYISRK